MNRSRKRGLERDLLVYRAHRDIPTQTVIRIFAGCQKAVNGKMLDRSAKKAPIVLAESPSPNEIQHWNGKLGRFGRVELA